MSAKRYIMVFIVLSLLILLVPACGGDGDKTTPTYTATPTATATKTPTAAPTPTANAEPVKIGAICSWSGPAAISGTAYGDPTIKFLEKQVNDAGGILGGRSIKVVKYDNRGAVAEATAGARKLFLEDKVSVLTLGGVSGAEFAAVSDAAEELKVPYVCFSQFSGIEEKQYTVVSSPPMSALTAGVVDVVINILKPQTASYIQTQDITRVESTNDRRKAIEAAGIKTVYLQDIPLGTSDLTPYLTQIKYKDPDVLVVNMDSEPCITMAKQIMELGGWGKTKVVALSQASSAAKMPGAEGWIIVTPWVPGLDYPASLKFEQDWKTIIGSKPSGNHTYFYLAMLTAVEAIKFADTDDPIKVAQELRSGNLQFDTPLGMAHFNQKGESGLKYTYAQIQKGGTIVLYNH